MQRALQNRNFDYYLTVNLHSADMSALFDTLALTIAGHLQNESAKAVRLLSHLIHAFDFVRFDMLHTSVDCQAVCFRPPAEAAFLGPVPLPSLLRFLRQHFATLQRILSANHFDWLHNLLSVRCSSTDTSNQFALSELIAAPDTTTLEQPESLVTTRKPMQLEQHFVGGQLVEQLCSVLARDRVRPFAVSLRELLLNNSSRLQNSSLNSTVAANSYPLTGAEENQNAELTALLRRNQLATSFACVCERCTVRYVVSFGVCFCLQKASDRLRMRSNSSLQPKHGFENTFICANFGHTEICGCFFLSGR